MAKFNVTGLVELQHEFIKLGEKAQKAVPFMLEAGAAVLVEAHKAEAAKFNLSGRSKGALVKSIKADKVKKSVETSFIEVFPHGTDKNHTKKGVKNAEKGFVLEYGHSKMPARPWISVANEKSEAAVNEAMRKVWEG